MFTIHDVLSVENQELAFEHLSTKRNNSGIDKVPLCEIREFWELNRERFTDDLLYGLYKPGLVQEYEIINGKGKKRTVVNFNSVDRLVGRMLTQSLNQALNPLFLCNSFAYQNNKGIKEAVEKAKEYIQDQCEYVVIIDLKNYFDEIPHKRLLTLIQEYIKDEPVISLIHNFLKCTVIKDGVIYRKEKGILQGSPISPVLSNLYLHSFDCFMEESGLRWIRFADDISIYVQSFEEGARVYPHLLRYIKEECLLPINEHKSGIYHVFERRLLGYDFYKRGNQISVKKHTYTKESSYRNWHPSALSLVNKEYHIVQPGILNKKDYAILFENAEEKHHIPIEATEQINIYNDVTITASAIKLLDQENIKLLICDKYGDALGYFIPEAYNADTKILLKQCSIYNDSKERLALARKMEIAALHNIRANLRYYNKKEAIDLNDTISLISQSIANINECQTINDMCLIEARCRQTYYECFNKILKNPEFVFTKRSRRPPLDPINALISFGNTLLYNKIQQIIWRLQLDSRIGIVHASNRRHYSLNLDFADLFKPIIVDRIIFSLINKKQIGIDDFIVASGGVYITESCKRVFIEAFEEKLQVKLLVHDKKYSYYQLLEEELRSYKKHLTDNEKYAPYKYR